MTLENFIEKVKLLKIEVTDDKIQALEIYYKELYNYNKHTNLTRIVEKEDVFLKHFYDSLTCSKVIEFNQINNILDIGSGAGFPGIVLKIFFPHIKVTLLDSNNKKTKFLAHMKNVLKMDLNIINERAENYAKSKINYYDLVVARSVANLRVLSELCIPFVKVNGYFLSMKGKITDEINDSKETLEILGAEIKCIESFNLGIDNGERNLVLIQKNSESKKSSIRMYDQILKKPLLKKVK